MSEQIEKEPDGKALDAWIDKYCFHGYFCTHSYTTDMCYVGELLAWCQDEPRYWDVLFLHDESYVQRVIDIYDGPNGTRQRVPYTDSAQLPAALCQAIYRAVKQRKMK